MLVSYGSGAGSSLPAPVLILAAVSTLIAVLVSSTSIYLHLKNYRKPQLQRMVIRIMLMVPTYAVSSLIALHSLEAAFVIDAIRDIYEAFVIYCFFVLLLSYLGGERSLLILLHGRPPKDAPFPVSLFRREIDVSDPYTFLFLKRGILQYVQVKPVLAAVTLVLKACGKYNEGDFRANSGYLYISIIYNVSICLALYCLAVFWICVNDDLKPFRPVPKFLCVKGILFFSFWQSIVISILVAAGVITKLGPYTDAEHISLGLTDTLICLEMPFFAFAHMYAFSHTDYIDRKTSYVARMPVYYAFRDAFGLLDVVEDSKTTLRGEGMDYREFEPAEGFMHQGDGRDRRIRAGLRYSKGGKRKYWLPEPMKATQPPGQFERSVNSVITQVVGPDQVEDVHAPLFVPEAENVVHLAPDLQNPDEEPDLWDSRKAEGGFELPFGDLDPDDEELFEHSTKYLFGDYNYPCIDISSEMARTSMWKDEERVLQDAREGWFSRPRDIEGRDASDPSGPERRGYGAVGSTQNGLRGRGGGPSHEHGPESSLIGYGPEDVSSSQPVDVKQVWTKIKGRDVPSASPSASPSPRSRRAGRSSTEGCATATDRLLSPPSGSRLRTDFYTRGKAQSPVPVLPPDAVDLIVEDTDAEVEGQTRERRKGEPGWRGGLRRVYRRGFVASSTGTQGEIEVQNLDGEERVYAGEEILDAIGAERDEESNEESHLRVLPDAEEVLVRAETPPLHARVVMHRYDEDNPWA